MKPVKLTAAANLGGNCVVCVEVVDSGLSECSARLRMLPV